MRLLPFVLVLLVPSAATAGTVFIANGLAPPNALNIIDASDDYSEDTVYVRNENCGDTTTSVCLAPGTPTLVHLIAGGATGIGLDVLDTSTLLIDGGTVGESLAALYQSTLVMQAGSVGDELNLGHDASAFLKGGTIGGVINVHGNARLTVFGTGFAIDGIPVPLGDVVALTGRLTGVLLTGDPIDNHFHRHESAMLVLVPEPGTSALLGAGLLLLRTIGRRHSQDAEKARQNAESSERSTPSPLR